MGIYKVYDNFFALLWGFSKSNMARWGPKFEDQPKMAFVPVTYHIGPYENAWKSWKSQFWSNRSPPNKNHNYWGVNICPINQKLSILKFGVLWNCLFSSTRIFLKLSIEMEMDAVNKCGPHRSTQATQYCTKWGIYFSLSKNCVFYIFFDLKCGRTSAYILASVRSKTVNHRKKILKLSSLSGFWNCLSWKGQIDGFLFTPAIILPWLWLRWHWH